MRDAFGELAKDPLYWVYLVACAVIGFTVPFGWSMFLALVMAITAYHLSTMVRGR